MKGRRVKVPFLNYSLGTVVRNQHGGYLVQMDDEYVVSRTFNYYPLVWMSEFSIETNTEEEPAQEEYLGEW